MIFHLYGLIVGVGIVAGWSVAEKIDPKVNKVLPWVLVGGIVGARLYHVIDQWSYYSQHLLNILAVWNGGLGIFGGVIGGIVGLIIAYYTIKTLDYWKTLAAIVTGLPLGQVIGRWGNLANNELWGIHHEPLFLYESVLDLILFGLLWGPTMRGSSSQAKVGAYLVGYGVIRLILEPFKPNPWIFGYYVAGGFVAVGVILIGLTMYTPIGYAKKHGRSNTQ
jgi:phosphatidylglycerol:prolipoprotein diacylglycerol transferase